MKDNKKGHIIALVFGISIYHALLFLVACLTGWILGEINENALLGISASYFLWLIIALLSKK